MLRNRVFLSYAHEDGEVVKSFLQILQNRDLLAREQCFWDENIRDGTQWHPQIQDALHVGEVAVLFLSHDFYRSEYIQSTELPRIRDKFDLGSLLVYPVYLDQSDPPSTHPAAEWIGKLKHPDGLDKPMEKPTEQGLAERMKAVCEKLVDELQSTRRDCYVLMTRKRLLLRRIVDAISQHRDLARRVWHQEPELPSINEQQAATILASRERYRRLLERFFETHHRWLITNLPMDQEENLRSMFDRFAANSEKYCLLVESGRRIPKEWERWKRSEPIAQRRESNPFLVVETDHRTAARKLLEKAAEKWQEEGAVKTMAVVSLIPEDSCASERARVYVKVLTDWLVDPEKTTLQNWKSPPDFDFYRWKVDGFTHEDTAAALDKNSRTLLAAIRADRSVFLCGNDDMAKVIGERVSRHRSRVPKRKVPTLLGFDGLLARESIDAHQLHYLTVAPDLQAMSEIIAGYVRQPASMTGKWPTVKKVNSRDPECYWSESRRDHGR